MKSNKSKSAISPTRSENYPEWYQQVIKASDLAEVSPVRGAMVIKPWGYAIWENIQRILDAEFKATGHKNVYFPLLIPLSFMQKEADHIEGFAKECAVVTHHRLAKDETGKLAPAGKLEEPYIIRPTSETIIGDAFSRWIQSYRDLPLLINQWANVVRWEMRTRLFLRTTEFLWQEGHTAHGTADEAMLEARQMLNVYAKFAEEYLAMPVIKGEKTESERFPGAVNTYCIESMMQDRKALQAGTSHFLGQHFAKGFNIKYLSKEGREEYVWTSSWGVSTRMIGGLIMTHSDDDGLILPPKIAPAHVVILPIIHKDEEAKNILSYAEHLQHELRKVTYDGRPLEIEIDRRELTGGEKNWSWVKKGIPIRLEVGMKEFNNHTVYMGRRDKPYREKTSLASEAFIGTVTIILDEMQKNLFHRAKAFQAENTTVVESKEEFYEYFNGDGGFAVAHFSGNSDVEEEIKKDLSVTVRCIPLEDASGPGRCIFTGDESPQQVIFAKAY